MQLLREGQKQRFIGGEVIEDCEQEGALRRKLRKIGGVYAGQAQKPVKALVILGQKRKRLQAAGLGLLRAYGGGSLPIEESTGIFFHSHFINLPPIHTQVNDRGRGDRPLTIPPTGFKS
jgi:hypothetical protein